MLTVGRVSFAPRTKELKITNTRNVNRPAGVVGISNMLQAIGIVCGAEDWPLPCLDMDELHRLNAERARAKAKRNPKE